VEKNRSLETSKTFIAMNRFKVIKQERKAFEDLWVARQSHLDEVNGFQAFHLLRGPERETMCSIHLIQYGRRKRILRHGPSLNNSVPPINTLASASRSHSGKKKRTLGRIEFSDDLPDPSSA
jgi:hypothetical protein